MFQPIYKWVVLLMIKVEQKNVQYYLRLPVFYISLSKEIQIFRKIELEIIPVKYLAAVCILSTVSHKYSTAMIEHYLA